MSQYPSPYQQPQYPGQPYAGQQYPAGYPGADPFEQALGPCKRAGVLMIVFGSLAMLLGVCVGSVFYVVPIEEAMRQQGMPMPPGVTVERMKREALISGIVFGAAGIAYVVLGVFVRRGGKAAAIIGLVLSFIAIGYCGLNIVGAVVLGGGMGAQVAMAACIMLVPIALLVWQIIWLFQAIGASSNYRNLQMQYQAQYYGYQQQQQMYGQQQPQQQWPGQQQQQWPGQYPPPPPQQPPPQT